MKCARIALLAALTAGVSWCGRATAQNLLTDGSFENPALYTADGPPFVGSWEGFNGGAGTSSQNDAVSPRTGLRDAHLNITATNNSFHPPTTISHSSATPSLFVSLISEIRPFDAT